MLKISVWQDPKCKNTCHYMFESKKKTVVVEANLKTERVKITEIEKEKVFA
jgi:hypothetical protein